MKFKGTVDVGEKSWDIYNHVMTEKKTTVPHIYWLAGFQKEKTVAVG